MFVTIKTQIGLPNILAAISATNSASYYAVEKKTESISFGSAAEFDDLRSIPLNSVYDNIITEVEYTPVKLNYQGRIQSLSLGGRSPCRAPLPPHPHSSPPSSLLPSPVCSRPSPPSLPSPPLEEGSSPGKF